VIALPELKSRAERAVGLLADCRLCPRDCGVNRLEGKWSACKTGRHAVVTSAFPHMGEEDCLRGWNGSGTIFFAHCNLRCVFCQNYDISQGVRPGPPASDGGGDGRRGPAGMPAGKIADLMLALRDRGCHNINFVTPEHVVPQVLEALVPAVQAGLNLPIVYNTSAYDSPESMALMDGVVDIYMPDFKLWSAERAKRWLRAEDYPDAARTALKAMHDQVGDLVIGADGLARRGLLIRHLVMPGALDETKAILEWIATELSPNSYVNLMDQYRPAGKVGGGKYPELDRRVPSAEFREAVAFAEGLGLSLDERRRRV